jgi:succinate dehydrogenase/fumarate reductase flavoprotein subunit
MKELVARTAVVGSGCAGLNAADWLYSLGERDFVLVTENMLSGTSRNTGSDKQTYYKLSLAGDEGDSVFDLAQTLKREDVDGDIALCEAAGSAQCFFKLVSLGVPFPCNSFGEYAGYQTDHDERRRATSAGPLTSRYMTQALEKACADAA